MTTSSSSGSRDPRLALRPGIHRLIQEMWEREEGARSFADPEGVHKMRVATRRVRSALQAAGDALEGKRYQSVKKNVRRLTRALGPVRDGDVMIGHLEEIATADEDHERPGIRRLIARLESERDMARTDLIAVLDELDESGFRKSSLAAFADASGSKKGKRDKDKRGISRKDARKMIREHVEEFVELTGTYPAEEQVEELHEVRIATKHLRYALQLLEESLQPESSELIPELTAMQDELGEIHNLDVLMDLIREELHTMVDEAANRAVQGHNGPHDESLAEWGDLLDLIRESAAERSERYQASAAQWGRLQNEGLTDRLKALAAGKKAATIKG